MESLSTNAEMAGEIACGRFVLQVGEPGGTALREARRAERAHFRSRPAPVMVRPRLLRGLVDRRTETAAALSALDAGLPVEVSGAPGTGKTAFLRHLAHHPRATSFVDGIVYLPARHQTAVDLLQQIFEAFYESDTVCKPTHAEICRALQDTHALILLDGVDLAQSDAEHVLDAAPRSAFVVATRERCLWGEVRSIALTGLTAEDGAQLLERELERALDAEEQSAAMGLSAALEGHPRRIRQAAAAIRERAIPAGEWSRYRTPDDLVADLVTSIDEKERRILLALAALAGVGIDAPHVAGIAELTDVEPSLMRLVDRGLLVNGDSRYRLAEGIADRLRRAGDLAPWVNRAITYFTAWAERQRRSRETLLEASDALVRVQQHAGEARRWGETLRLGRLLETPLVTGARWGAWGLALEGCLTAARALGDRTVEAWVVHEMGTRAVCLGEEADARRLLPQSAALRETSGEHAAAAISRRNLGFLPAAVAPATPEVPAPAVAGAPEFDSLPFRSEDARAVDVSRHRVNTRSASALLVTFLICGIVGGLAYAIFGDLSWRPWETSGGGSPQTSESTSPTAAVTPLPLRETTEVEMSRAQPPAAAHRANILIFTARPGSIATARATNLCYAVSDAARARIEPGVGDVDPSATLTCRRVAPVRTTAYELTATGPDGIPVTQQVVIVVR